MSAIDDAARRLRNVRHSQNPRDLEVALDVAARALEEIAKRLDALEAKPR